MQALRRLIVLLSCNLLSLTIVSLEHLIHFNFFILCQLTMPGLITLPATQRQAFGAFLHVLNADFGIPKHRDNNVHELIHQRPRKSASQDWPDLSGAA